MFSGKNVHVPYVSKTKIKIAGKEANTKQSKKSARSRKVAEDAAAAAEEVAADEAPAEE